MSLEILTTIAAQQTANLQRVAQQIGGDIAPYIKRIEAGIFKILAHYEDMSITQQRRDKIIADIAEVTNAELTAYALHVGAQIKLVTTEEVAAGVMALDAAIESDVEINKPAKAAVNAAVIATPIQQGDKSWTTYKGIQDAFKAQYAGEIDSAVLVALQGATNGKEVSDALYQQIHYTGKKASKSVLDRARRSANSVAATLTNHAANVARVQFGEANKKLIKGYVFVAVIDSQTSQTCRAGDQTTMQADDPRFAAWAPPRHRGCRSAITYDVDDKYKLDDSDTKRQQSFTVDGYRDPKQTSSKGIYYDKMLTLSAADQDYIMGPTLGKAFRAGINDGTLTPESFAQMTVDSLYQPLTIEQLREKNNRLGEILRKQAKG